MIWLFLLVRRLNLQALPAIVYTHVQQKCSFLVCNQFASRRCTHHLTSASLQPIAVHVTLFLSKIIMKQGTLRRFPFRQNARNSRAKMIEEYRKKGRDFEPYFTCRQYSNSLYISCVMLTCNKSIICIRYYRFAYAHI